MRLLRSTLGVLAALGATAVLPAAASAATCDLPSQAEPGFATALDVQGDVAASRAGGYLQLPFDVPAGTTAIRVRYSYDQPGDSCMTPPSPAPSNTLDIRLYSPRDPGDAAWGPDESRGWSGSAVRDFAVAENGFSAESVYEAAPKALVRGHTTRAYRPGPIPAGRWAVELGLAFIAPDTPLDSNGVHYRVLVETTSSPDWSNDPHAPAGYSTTAVRGASGWYSGDFHVHGEQEPGNATVTDTLAEAYGPQASGGADLDFVMLVDHNNNVQHDDLAGYQAANPRDLVIPGTEVTTYRGHHNNLGRGPFVDFRGGPVVAPAPGTPLNADVPDSALQQTQAPVPPAGPFAELTAGGNLSQINHPTIFRELPSFCRGCAWGYDGAETDYSKVDAIEIQTGPAAVPASSASAPNPYTASAIAFYEAALDTGAHVAAVGSSDDHRGGSGTGPFDSPVGRAATMVFADELSEEAVKQGVRDDHTYVKVFGSDGPDVSFTARSPDSRKSAIIGDTVNGRSAELTASVTGVARSGRPGAYSIVLLKNGIQLERVPFAGDEFSQVFESAGTGRYSIAVLRNQGAIDYTEVYTSPIWLGTGGGGGAEPSKRFRIVKVDRNARRGTAKVTAKVPGAGRLVLSGRGLRKVERLPDSAGREKLAVQLKSKGAIAELRRSGNAQVRARITFEPQQGAPQRKSRRIELRLRPASRG